MKKIGELTTSSPLISPFYDDKHFRYTQLTLTHTLRATRKRQHYASDLFNNYSQFQHPTTREEIRSLTLVTPGPPSQT